MGEEVVDEVFVDAEEGTEFTDGYGAVFGFVVELPDFFQDGITGAGAAPGNAFDVFGVNDNAVFYLFHSVFFGLQIFIQGFI